MRSLRFALGLALVLYASVAARSLRSPAYATTVECQSHGSGTFCGVNSECVEVWVAANGTSLCSKYTYYNLYIAKPTDGCVYSFGRYMCPQDPVRGRMPTRKAEAYTLALALSFVALCTGLLAWRSTGRETVADAFRLSPEAGRPYSAYAVFQLADGPSRLGFLQAPERPRLRSRMSVQGLLVGRGTDLERARRLLDEQDLQLPVETADRRARLAGNAVGHRATPFLLVFDAQGRLRISAPIPVSPTEYLATIQMLEACGWRVSAVAGARIR